MRADITVPNVDVGLLRKQRDACLVLIDAMSMGEIQEYQSIDELNGLINMLDSMLDIAEGYK